MEKNHELSYDMAKAAIEKAGVSAKARRKVRSCFSAPSKQWLALATLSPVVAVVLVAVINSGAPVLLWGVLTVTSFLTVVATSEFIDIRKNQNVLMNNDMAYRLMRHSDASGTVALRKAFLDAATKYPDVFPAQVIHWDPVFRAYQDKWDDLEVLTALKLSQEFPGSLLDLERVVHTTLN